MQQSLSCASSALQTPFSRWRTNINSYHSSWPGCHTEFCYLLTNSMTLTNHRPRNKAQAYCRENDAGNTAESVRKTASTSANQKSTNATPPFTASKWNRRGCITYNKPRTQKNTIQWSMFLQRRSPQWPNMVHRHKYITSLQPSNT